MVSWVNSQHQRLFNPPDPLEGLMTANQMHIHTLINQLAANGYTYSRQNTVDSLWDTHNFHFTRDSFLAKWGREEAVSRSHQLHAPYLPARFTAAAAAEWRIVRETWGNKFILKIRVNVKKMLSHKKQTENCLCLSIADSSFLCWISFWLPNQHLNKINGQSIDSIKRSGMQSAFGVMQQAVSISVSERNLKINLM